MNSEKATGTHDGYKGNPCVTHDCPECHTHTQGETRDCQQDNPCVLIKNFKEKSTTR